MKLVIMQFKEKTLESPKCRQKNNDNIYLINGVGVVGWDKLA
jgi:hypothetical protein